MSPAKYLRVFAITAGFSLFGAMAYGADDCGEAPEKPEILDGAEATMEELVTKSNQVTAFIEKADEYLDCKEAYGQSEEFQELSEEEQVSWHKDRMELLDERNGIADEFNAEVAAFREANPDAGNSE